MTSQVLIGSKPLPQTAARRKPAVRPRAGVIFGVVLVTIVLAVIAGPHVWQQSPTSHNPGTTLLAPSASHPLGTDQFGRDTLARVLTGGRWTLLGAALVSVCISAIGLLIGAAAVSFGRVADILLSRLIEAVMAIPGLVIALALTSLLGPSFRNLLIAMIASGWPWYARAYRAVILRERSCQYVEGAVAAGATPLRVMLRHIAPNVAGQVLVLATVNVGSVILGIAALSFLGLGIQPPAPEWGAMINDARLYFQSHPAQMIIPGFCITVTVLSVNLAGDAVRDALDPRLKGRR